MKSDWNSIQKIKKLYHRHMLRNAIAFFCVSLLTGLLAFQALFTMVILFDISSTTINVLFVLGVTGISYAIINGLINWGKQGFRIKSYFHRWEHQHPELSNRSTLLVYADRYPDEINRLGYSTSLLQADNQWLDQYIETHLKRDPSIFPKSLVAAVALVIISMAALAGINYYKDVHFATIAHALDVRLESHVLPKIQVPDNLTLKRGESIDLIANVASTNGSGQNVDLWESTLADLQSFIHIQEPGGWRRVPAVVESNQLTYTLPAVHQQLNYYFSFKERLSNRGTITPLDSPQLVRGSITIDPPAYTNQSQIVMKSLRPFAVPQGSLVKVNAETTSPLEEATFTFNGETEATFFNDRHVEGAFVADRSGDFYFSMKDQNGLEGQSPTMRATVVEDATPRAEILYPKAMAEVPDLLVQKVQMHVQDDYGILKVALHSQVNKQPESNKQVLIWDYSPEKADQVDGATDFYLTVDWDLAALALFPGDEVNYYIEVWDNDVLNQPKYGRSQTHTLKYPSLTDLLAELDRQEKDNMRDLGKIVEEQSEISKEAQETIQKISEKIENAPLNEEGDKEFWLEEQELEALKKRQEELVNEAKQLEERLQDYQEQAEETLAQDQQEAEPEDTPQSEAPQQEQFTPETLEKMSRIQDLMSELIDQDSQQLLKQIEDTINQLSEQVNPQDLDQLDFSFQEFDQQLERTLSMLESTYQMRQLDGLQKTMQDLAQRQDHLERETDKLASEKEALQNELAEHEQNKPEDSGQQSAEGDESATDEQAQSEAMEEWQAKKEELENQLNELEQREQILENRQEHLSEDTQSMLDRMQEMQEEMQEDNPQLAKQLENMQNQAQDGNLQQEMRKASQQLQQQNPRQAQQHQQNAQQQLQQMAQQMQEQMQGMSGMQMQMDTQGVERLVDRSLFLSNQLEMITIEQSLQSDPLLVLQKAQAFERETQRIQSQWNEMAQTNPFLSRTVDQDLTQTKNQLRQAIVSGKGKRWVGIDEARQSLFAMNDAIYAMMQDLEQMQQQMQQQQQQQSGAQSLQQQMQQMLGEQQSIQEMLQQMRQMMQEGNQDQQQMAQQMMQMAQRQAQIRQEIEKMMQQFRHEQQLKNRLQGIYQEMKDVENMLGEGINDEEMAEKQKRIMTRMLEAGTMQEKDEFGNERKEQVAETGTDGSNAPEDVPMTLEEKLKSNIERPDPEEIPVQYREAIKNHFIELSKQLSE